MAIGVMTHKTNEGNFSRRSKFQLLDITGDANAIFVLETYKVFEKRFKFIMANEFIELKDKVNFADPYA